MERKKEKKKERKKERKDGERVCARRYPSMSNYPPSHQTTKVSDATLGTSGVWLGTRTGAGSTATQLKEFFWLQPMALWTEENRDKIYIYKRNLKNNNNNNNNMKKRNKGSYLPNLIFSSKYNDKITSLKIMVQISLRINCLQVHFQYPLLIHGLKLKLSIDAGKGIFMEQVYRVIGLIQLRIGIIGEPL